MAKQLLRLEDRNDVINEQLQVFRYRCRLQRKAVTSVSIHPFLDESHELLRLQCLGDDVLSKARSRSGRGELSRQRLLGVDPLDVKPGIGGQHLPAEGWIDAAFELLAATGRLDLGAAEHEAESREDPYIAGLTTVASLRERPHTKGRQCETVGEEHSVQQARSAIAVERT